MANSLTQRKSSASAAKVKEILASRGKGRTEELSSGAKTGGNSPPVKTHNRDGVETPKPQRRRN